MTPIHVTPAGRASVDPVAARFVAEVEAKKVTLAPPIVLRKIKLHPVPKGTMK